MKNEPGLFSVGLDAVVINSLGGLLSLVDASIDFIKEHEPEDGYFVGFSGGKDSIVTLDLVRQAGVKHTAYYAMTLIDPPEVVAFIRTNYPDVTRLMPDMTFWQGCLKKNMPLRMRRWCCDVLKHNTKALRAVPQKQAIVGIRGEESSRRKQRGQIQYNKSNKQTLYCPIFEWSSADVWEYIHTRNLPYPALYDEGFARLGCIVCPFLGKGTLERHRERWPGMYRVLDRTLKTIWERDSVKLIDQGFTEDEFMKWPLWMTKSERSQGVMTYE